ncbi:hypothetical protein ACWDBD_21500 [Streptomyces sp. NPDC001118]
MSQTTLPVRTDDPVTSCEASPKALVGASRVRPVVLEELSESEKNTTREGILVRRGQIWENLDIWQNQRRVVVEFVESGRARVRAHYGTRRSTISVSRMHKHSRGFRLVEPGELKYGVPTVSSDKTAQR